MENNLITDVGIKFGGARKDLYNGRTSPLKKPTSANSFDVDLFLSDFSSDADGVDQLSSFQSLSSKGKLWKVA